MLSNPPPSKTHKSNVFHWNYKQRLLSGVLMLVPFTITMLLIIWLYGQIRNIIRPLVSHLLNIVINLPGFGSVPSIFLRVMVFALTILILFLILYMIGSISTWVLGKRLIALVEGLIRKIPLAGTFYGASKQVVDAFGGTENPAYKSVVLVEFPRSGCKALGFLTGFITLNGHDRYAKVIIPTSPNPTTGFFELFPIDEIQEVDMTVEDAFKMLLSFGLVAPEYMNLSSIPKAPVD